MRLTLPCSLPTHDPVADLDRPFDQQDQPGHEVVDDRLQAKADTDRQRARDNREVGDVEAGIGNGDHRREDRASVSDGCVDRIGDAGIHLRLHQHSFAQAPLDKPRCKQHRHEQRDADHDAHQRNFELTDLKAEQHRLDPIADVSAREAPLQHHQRQRDQRETDGQQAFRQPAELLAARLRRARSVLRGTG